MNTAAAWERALCSEADGGCGPLIDPDGYEAPEQEATPAIDACPVCGDEAPRCRYHWEEHVEDHTRLGAQLVAHNHGYFALAREDGWYIPVTGERAVEWRSAEHLRVLSGEFAGDESRIPAALRGRLAAAEKSRQAFAAALRARAGSFYPDDLGGLADFIREWQELIRSLDSEALGEIVLLGEAARAGEVAWKRECARADRANGCLHRDDHAKYCASCGWSRHQTWCYTDRCPWCDAIAPLCAQCAETEDDA